MSTKRKSSKYVMAVFSIILMVAACNHSTNNDLQNTSQQDSLSAPSHDENDAKTPGGISDKVTGNIQAPVMSSAIKSDLPTVLIYNFHVTNRCAACIAIEEATTKTLNIYFQGEVKQGRIKRQILNVDDDANRFISEKYEAFGSGLFITRVFKGKETTADLTGDGFKFAKNKEERFIEILKNKITEFLK